MRLLSRTELQSLARSSSGQENGAFSGHRDLSLLSLSLIKVNSVLRLVLLFLLRLLDIERILRGKDAWVEEWALFVDRSKRVYLNSCLLVVGLKHILVRLVSFLNCFIPLLLCVREILGLRSVVHL